MSWFKSAMSKAADVRGNSNITRNVKNYAGTVFQHAGQAVAEGAKLIQDKMTVRNASNFKQAVKRLDEVAIYSKGPERAQALNRWLRGLKDIYEDSKLAFDAADRNSEHSPTADDARISPRKASLVLFYDPDSRDGPLNFRDVFLHSQALENLTISMIIDAPTDDEISLLLELFELTLMGGREVHNAIISGIQDLARSFSSYEEEVLMKREELLHFVRVAIAGLKVHAELPRIDAEIAKLKHQLEERKTEKTVIDDSCMVPKEEFHGVFSRSGLDMNQGTIQMFCKLQTLLQRKKSILYNGYSEEAHAQKVEKLRLLAESLAKSMTKAEKQIEENRNENEEALKYRVTRSQEAEQIEKEVLSEINVLQEKRAKLLAELKNIDASLAVVLSRQKNAQEERDQFVEASDQLISHLKIQENELVRSITAQKNESMIMNTWKNFLEDTWILRSSQVRHHEEALTNELEGVHQTLVDTLVTDLSSYKDHLQILLQKMELCRQCINDLLEQRNKVESNSPDVEKLLQERRNTEEAYILAESQAISILGVVDNLKAEFYTQEGSFSRATEKGLEAFGWIDQIKRDFEAFKRPVLQREPVASREAANSDEKEESLEYQPEKSQEHATNEQMEKLPSSASKDDENASVADTLDPEAELAKLESEFGKSEEGFSSQDVGGWGFDDIEQELRSEK